MSPRLWVITVLVLCGTGCREDPNTPPERLLKVLEAARPAREALLRIPASVPDVATLKETPCPPGIKPLRIGWKDLQMVAPKEKKLPDDPKAFVAGTRRVRVPEAPFHYQFPLESYQRNWNSRVEQATEDLASFQQATHVRLIRLGAVTKPVVGRTERAGYHVGAGLTTGFTPGKAEAWLVTFDKDGPRVVCAQRVTATNAASGIRMKGSAQESLDEDLMYRLGRAVEEADPGW